MIDNEAWAIAALLLTIILAGLLSLAGRGQAVGVPFPHPFRGAARNKEVGAMREIKITRQANGLIAFLDAATGEDLHGRTFVPTGPNRTMLLGDGTLSRTDAATGESEEEAVQLVEVNWDVKL